MPADRTGPAPLEVSARATGPVPLDATFRVEPGEMLALVGPSGAGKTTFLRTIAGFWKPERARVASGGQVWLDTEAGIALAPHRRRVGFVFQGYALFPHLGALGNVMCATGEGSRAVRRAEAERLLGLVGLADAADRKPAELSGGERQRVALARALARRPDALLLDEPFSAVDRPSRERLQAAIARLRAGLAMPVVLVTHDVNEAQLLSDRMAVIERGRLLRAGSTASVMADADALRVLGLREVAALLPAVVEVHEADGITRLATASGPLFLPRVEGGPGTRVRVRIMAHEVILARGRPEGLSAQNILAGTVTRLVPGEGPGVMVHVDLRGSEIVARITRRAADALALAPGVPVHAILKSMSVARDHVGAGGPGDGSPAAPRLDT